jgi:hypothetical protein
MRQPKWSLLLREPQRNGSQAGDRSLLVEGCNLHQQQAGAFEILCLIDLWERASERLWARAEAQHAASRQSGAARARPA